MTYSASAYVGGVGAGVVPCCKALSATRNYIITMCTLDVATKVAGGISVFDCEELGHPLSTG